MKKSYTLRAVTGTDTGQIRSINQDNVFSLIRDQGSGISLGLFIVADGMGGHQAGEIASRLAVEAIREHLSFFLEPGDPTEATLVVPNLASKSMKKQLQAAVQKANRVIFEYAQENPVDAGNLGCTVTCAVIFGDSAIVANVGDSRTYRLRSGELTQITDDHSYVGQLVREGHLKDEEIYDHPQRNVITRALGNQPEVTVDTWTCQLDPDDRLLLCSDGVWEMIRDPQELARLIGTENLEKAVEKLIVAANSYGGVDNIGLVIVEVKSGDHAPEKPEEEQ